MLKLTSYLHRIKTDFLGEGLRPGEYWAKKRGVAAFYARGYESGINCGVFTSPDMPAGLTGVQAQAFKMGFYDAQDDIIRQW